MGAAPPLRRVLVVFKSTKLERYAERDRIQPDDGTDEDAHTAWSRLRLAHEEHSASVAEVERIFERSGLEVTRAIQLRKSDARRADLVVPVGGDGTFLWCASRVDDAPMLGVNSAPATSTGHYCGVRADTLEPALDAILSGTMRPRELTRIHVEIDGRALPYAALNEVLFAHRSPAASARYILRVDGQPEVHVSSGVWVSTPSGSTGAIRSAGGDRMPDDDPRLQFLVREPYARNGGSKLQRIHGYGQEVSILSRSPSNGVFLDGPGISYQVGFAGRVSLRPAARKLQVYAYRGADR